MKKDDAVHAIADLLALVSSLLRDISTSDVADGIVSKETQLALRIDSIAKDVAALSGSALQ